MGRLRVAHERHRARSQYSIKFFFVRQVQLYKALEEDIQGLSRRHDKKMDKLDKLMAFQWDYVALVRRLAVLEDQVAALSGKKRRNSW